MKWDRYEIAKYETWPSVKRVTKIRAEQILERAEKLADRLPKWRYGKRLERLEKKLDMPFIHESGLSQEVDDVKALIAEFLTKKKVKK